MTRWTKWGAHTNNKPAVGDLVVLLGTSGVGKAVSRNLVAADILRRHQASRALGDCLVVADHAGSTVSASLLLRLRWHNDEANVQVAVVKPRRGEGINSGLVQAASRMIDTGGRVYHLRDCSRGRLNDNSELGSILMTQQFTFVTSSPHQVIRKDVDEWEKGRWVMALYAPLSTEQEMMELAQLLHPDWDGDDVELQAKDVCARYGCIPRRLMNCWTDSQQADRDREIRRMVVEWAFNNRGRLPSTASFASTIIDKVAKRVTCFPDDVDAVFNAAAARRWFTPARTWWASGYITRIVAEPMYNRLPLVFQRRYDSGCGAPPGERGTVAEYLMLRMFEVGLRYARQMPIRSVRKATEQDLVGTHLGDKAQRRGEELHQVEQAAGGRHRQVDTLVRQERQRLANEINAAARVTVKALPSLGECKVTRVVTGDERRVVRRERDRLSGADNEKPALIHLLSCTDKCIDGAIMFRHDDDTIHVSLLQVAISRGISGEGARTIRRWRDMCEEEGLTFDALVYAVAPAQYSKWRTQDHVPRFVPEVVCTTVRSSWSMR